MSDAAARLDLSRLPNFCAHEHWGSINSIGMSPESFRGDTEQGATPNRATRLTDLLLDPYLGGFIWMAGSDPERLAREAGGKDLAQLQERSAAEAFRALRPALARQRLAGTYACLRGGLRLLYDIDPETASPAALEKLDAAIGERYGDLFGWYRKAMEKAHFSALIRPVHPVYYCRKQSAETAAAEAAFTRTMLRIDPILGFWRRDAPGRADLVRMTGEDPGDAAGWRRFIGMLCDLAAAGGGVGIKQLQAYTRSLEFTRPSDNEVVWSGDLTEAQRRTFEDWVVHECCRQAHDRGWPHQVHVGTHNLPNSSPLPLASLAERYRRMKIVQIHAWPFANEAAWLAKMHPNVYVDTNWLPVLSPAFYRDTVRTYLGFVPAHKIMAAHDSTSVEMAAGSSLIVREILAEELSAAGRSARVPTADLRQIGADILHHNAEGVYGVGKQR